MAGRISALLQGLVTVWLLITGAERTRADCRNCTIKPHLPCSVVEEPGGNCDIPSVPGEWPPEPERLDVSVGTGNYSEPYLHIEWEPPNTSLEHLKGFQLKVMIMSGPDVNKILACIMFNMSAALWKSEDAYVGRSVFSYDCIFPLGPHAGQTLFVQLYSLPIPRAGQIDKRLEMIVTLPEGSGPEQICANNWHSPVFASLEQVKSQGKTLPLVNVSFFKGNEEFGYSRYDLHLVRVEEKGAYKSVKKIELFSKDLGDPKVKRVFVNFSLEAIPCGVYHVRMSPYVAPFTCCDCKKFCDQWCDVSRSNNVTFEGCLPVNMPPTTRSSPAAGIIVGIVAGIIGILLLITICVACVIYQKKKIPNKQHRRANDMAAFVQGQTLPQSFYTGPEDHLVGTPRNLQQDHENGIPGLNNQYPGIHGGHIPEQRQPAEKKALESAPKKKVLIIYSEDHVFHTRVVNCFAHFLQELCNCDVLFDKWDMYKMYQGPYAWLSNGIDIADKCIIVCSLGAIAKYKYNCANLPLESKIPQPQGDMFTPALSIIRQILFRCQDESSGNRGNRFLQVVFPYSEKKFCKKDCFIRDVSPGVHYSLMKHLESLVMDIHGICPFAPKQEQRITGLGEGEYHHYKEGTALKNAIEAMCEFVKAKPNWIHDQFEYPSVDSKKDSGVADLEGEPSLPPPSNVNSASSGGEPPRIDMGENDGDEMHLPSILPEDMFVQGDRTETDPSEESTDLGNVGHSEISSGENYVYSQDDGRRPPDLESHDLPRHEFHDSDVTSELDVRSLCKRMDNPAAEPPENRANISPDQVTLGTFTDSEILNFMDFGSGVNPSFGVIPEDESIATIGLDLRSGNRHAAGGRVNDNQGIPIEGNFHADGIGDDDQYWSGAGLESSTDMVDDMFRFLTDDGDSVGGVSV